MARIYLILKIKHRAQKSKRHLEASIQLARVFVKENIVQAKETRHSMLQGRQIARSSPSVAVHECHTWVTECTKPMPSGTLQEVRK